MNAGADAIDALYLTYDQFRAKMDEFKVSSTLLSLAGPLSGRLRSSLGASDPYHCYLIDDAERGRRPAAQEQDPPRLRRRQRPAQGRRLHDRHPACHRPLSAQL